MQHSSIEDGLKWVFWNEVKSKQTSSSLLRWRRVSIFKTFFQVKHNQCTSQSLLCSLQEEFHSKCSALSLSPTTCVTRRSVEVEKDVTSTPSPSVFGLRNTVCLPDTLTAPPRDDSRPHLLCDPSATSSGSCSKAATSLVMKPIKSKTHRQTHGVSSWKGMMCKKVSSSSFSSRILLFLNATCTSTSRQYDDDDIK